jgi:predicted DNA-binding protein
MKTFSIRLPEEVWSELERLAQEQGLKPGQIIRSVLIRMVRGKQQPNFGEVPA